MASLWPCSPSVQGLDAVGSQSREYFKASGIKSLPFPCTCKTCGFRRGWEDETRSRTKKTAAGQWCSCLNNSPASGVYLIGLPLSVLKRLYFLSSLWRICLICQLKKHIAWEKIGKTKQFPIPRKRRTTHLQVLENFLMGVSCKDFAENPHEKAYRKMEAVQNNQSQLWGNKPT